MSLTNFPNGISSFGIPLYGTLPVIKGKWYFVDPENGSAGGGNGKYAGQRPDKAFSNISYAYPVLVNGDGIVLLSSGTTTANTTSYLTEAITWSLSNITVVGISAPTREFQRSRIANASTANALSTLITMTGSNNRFYNVHMYNGGTTGTGCLALSSANRNYFYNCHFIGGAGVTAASTSDLDVSMTASNENTFERCTFGSDTFDKGDNAGAEVQFATGCMRNYFIDCYFKAYRSAGTTAGMVKLAGSGDSIIRDTVFDNCKFLLYRDGNIASEVGVVIGTMPNNGHIMFLGGSTVRKGFTDWATTATNRVFSGCPTYTEAGGSAIVVNPS